MAELIAVAALFIGILLIVAILSAFPVMLLEKGVPHAS